MSYSQMLKTNSNLNPAAAAASQNMPVSQSGPHSQGSLQNKADISQSRGPASALSPTQSLVSGFPQKVLTSPGIPPSPLATIPLTNQNGSLSSDLGSAGMTGSLSTAAPINSEMMQQQQQMQNTLANTKEKTPMCLINELARYNKIMHQYTLVDEQGPAHKKTFYVRLRMGEEEYSSSGPSIKKAQHAAAGIALEKTSFAHPPPKPNRNPNIGLNNITPTVELNALAMKRGEPAVYKPIEPRHPPYYPPPSFDYRGMYNQRYHYGRMPRTFYVSLKVGQKEFIGDGPTRQAARHNAANKALRILRSMGVPTEDKREPEEDPIDQEEKDQLKSEISLVHEIALKRNLPVNFEVTRESGPPHMKVFVTKCTVGDFITESEGNSKKLSKKRAAELMLEKLKTLPVLHMGSVMKPKIKTTINKKKNRNLIKLSDAMVLQKHPSYGTDVAGIHIDGMHALKMQKADPNYGVGINPISRLIQIMQAQKKKEPVYSLVAERGLPRRREFVMQVQVEENTCTGVGPNKKLAKRNAAEAMLQLLGYSRPSPQPTKSAIKTASPDVGGGDKKVTFVESSTENGALGGGVNSKTGRQLVPGLLLIPHSGIGQNMGGSSFTGHHPEQQLHELASRHKIDIVFDDYSGKVPLGNPKENLSRVSLSTNPPHILHGTGPTPEASRRSAAISALKVLDEMGLAAYKDDKKIVGDGLQIKSEPDPLVPHPSMGGATAQLMKKD